MVILTNPWHGLSKRRLIGTLVFVLFMGMVIAVLGQLWITNSEPYELGREAVGSRLGVAAESVELNRLAPFRYSDGSFTGEALFVLCGPRAKCFTVVTKKRDARWEVVDLVEKK